MAGIVIGLALVAVGISLGYAVVLVLDVVAGWVHRRRSRERLRW
jgi:hypothetical protein